MGFWVFMLIMNLLIPLTMIGFGLLFLKKAPKDINYIFGYRTEMSMKNRDTWEFAHRYCGRLWFVIGLILLPLSCLPLMFTIGKGEDTVGTVGAAVELAQLIFLIAPIFPTEAALKKAFDKNGTRRDAQDK